MLAPPGPELSLVTYKYLPEGSITTELETVPLGAIGMGVPGRGDSAPVDVLIVYTHSFSELPLTAYKNWPERGSTTREYMPNSAGKGEPGTTLRLPLAALILKALMSEDWAFATYRNRCDGSAASAKD